MHTAPRSPLSSRRELRHAAGTRERRGYLAKVETRSLTPEEKSAGYIGALTGIIPLNTDSVVLRDRSLNGGQPFVERIAAKAFAGAADVIAVVGHTDDPLAAFARTGANLTLTESADELRWDALLPDTQAARDLAELGARGIICGTSFEFERGAADTWEKRGDGTAVRTVTRGKLTRVNPVLDPAYGTSEINVSRGRMHGSEGRGYYIAVDTYDPTLTPDCIYAMESLASELAALGEAQDYLRTNPAGAHIAYAATTVADCGAEIAALLAWLMANGSTPSLTPGPGMDGLMARARTAAAELRAAQSPSPSPSPSEDARETRLRILTK